MLSLISMYASQYMFKGNILDRAGYELWILALSGCDQSCELSTFVIPFHFFSGWQLLIPVGKRSSM